MRPASFATRILAGYPHGLFALFEETGLVHHQHPALLLAQMLDYVPAQVVADGVGVPAGRVQ